MSMSPDETPRSSAPARSGGETPIPMHLVEEGYRQRLSVIRWIASHPLQPGETAEGRLLAIAGEADAHLAAPPVAVANSVGEANGPPAVARPVAEATTRAS
jgi:hypothetical protein